MQRVTCNLLSNFKCNSSAIFTSYCYFECNEIVAIYYKKSLVTWQICNTVTFTSSDTVTIPNRTHVKKAHNFLLPRKSDEVAFLGRNAARYF
jgi:hypothetical protein